ncbi:Cytochrome bd ubiquinol oxidase, subunit II [Rhodopseudomonas palustris HaA2]|uniref:Cytochrome bd ubiquinol oxidase, subunit II n=1 Tax=Rhodopseudomonas palustris (strain HaA2) TaxID=316058 RepID=Q2J3P3_RHOP2|nr:cytochrome d ubiquinol oxidase subunit II [Rhodopseudomonas palustris]ABD04917.1 Cytochrome bd ubiquinol oxidase, subunit II [Rhodopseudomonas palustris HaA2]
MSMLSGFDFAVFFAVGAAVVIGLYVVLDGVDLGVGILFPFAPRSSDRDLMMATLEPFWDGNETWLVLGGMVLLAGFPLAFAILLPAFYVPLCLMLFGLVIRGIAFEFRSQGGPFEIAWSTTFAVGSFIAAFCQGAILGAFVGRYIAVVDGAFAGGPFDWLGLFSIATGLGVVAGYGLLGACWLIWKTGGATQMFARELVLPTLLCVGAAILLISVWTPFVKPQIADRWFAWPDFVWLAPMPIVAVAAWLGVWLTRWSEREWAPLALSLLLFMASLAGLGASVWPEAVPGSMTIWQASSMHRTQLIVAGALVIVMPIILAYIGYGYWLFRGKTRPAPDLRQN